MEGMRQFEIWWADFQAPVGRRPVLLISRDDAHDYVSKLIAVEMTSTIRNIASEVLLGEVEGLPRACVANCDNFRMVPRVALTKRIGQVSLERRIKVKRAVGAVLGWRELTD